MILPRRVSTMPKSAPASAPAIVNPILSWRRVAKSGSRRVIIYSVVSVERPPRDAALVASGKVWPPQYPSKAYIVAAEPRDLAGSKRLLAGTACHTLHDMKTSALTIRLDPTLERQLARAARRTGRSRSELVRDALRRQLALAQFEDLRRRIMPLAEARGYLTDEDVFRDVS